ncbi:MAG: CRISPR-associated endoribonuclease Cas6 [Nitrososphaeraceae archaeon]|nr:CRISPR-associated endoribonuclease Cas6 [Nitrososphaeraceae archaeon]
MLYYRIFLNFLNKLNFLYLFRTENIKRSLLIKNNEKYSFLHDKAGYKFFCFSNIFPFSETIYENDIRKLVISSPDHIFIDTLSLSLNTLPNYMVNIGKMKFKFMDFKKIDPIIPKNEPFSLITGTPIIMRISLEKFSDHKSDFKDFPYFYWKKNFPLDFFISQLENTLIKKYEEYCQYQNKVQPNEHVHLFERFRFKKQVSTQIRMKRLSYKVIGTLWIFEFEDWGNRNLIKFALDAGLGERNCLRKN